MAPSRQRMEHGEEEGSQRFVRRKRSTTLRRLRRPLVDSRVHVQIIELNPETKKKCRHRADGGKCLLSFAFMGLLL